MSHKRNRHGGHTFDCFESLLGVGIQETQKIALDSSFRAPCLVQEADRTPLVTHS